ncbi:MAG: iron-sulfur cluster assembly accessory protein [Thermoleophilia bacterium]|nr:iron-sulfur cluster assembly accessory protein [Thermoleophilia bacterium]
MADPAPAGAATADAPDRPLTLEEKKAAARARARAAREAQQAGAAILDVTESAAGYIREVADREGKDHGVRLRILAGGCSGLEYRIDLTDPGEPARPDEREVASNGIRVLMDLKSAIYVTGSVIDYERTLLRRGFKIRNPNATSTCSCGESFGV